MFISIHSQKFCFILFYYLKSFLVGSGMACFVICHIQAVPQGVSFRTVSDKIWTDKWITLDAVVDINL